MKPALFVLLILIVIFLLYYFLRLLYLLQLGGDLSKKAVPYQQTVPNPTAHVLIVGDSLGSGVGADDNKKSIAGYLGTEYPKINITNLSIPGMRGAKLLEKLIQTNIKKPDFSYHSDIEKYDFVILHTGGGDTLYLTNPDQMQTTLEKIILELKKRSDKIILISSGDIGMAPFIPWFAAAFYSHQTQLVRTRFMETANENDVYYVDLFTDIEKELFKQHPGYYAADGLHLSSEGYKYWYSHIKKVISDNRLLSP